MSKYTREQIDKARQLADHAFSETAHRNRQHDGDIVAGAMRHPGDEWIDTFTEALGLDVESEKPEPGTWHLTRTEGWPAFIGDGGDLIVVEPSGVLDFYYADHDDWPDLEPATPPARVVPAEPVELSEAEVGELWDGELLPTHQHDCWDVWRESFNANMVRTVNAALAKHGHGRVFHQSTIEDALRVGLKGTGEDLSPQVRQRAADAVYSALLEASK